MTFRALIRHSEPDAHFEAPRSLDVIQDAHFEMRARAKTVCNIILLKYI